MSVIEEAFEALFFSEAGSILGLLLIIILVTSITVQKPVVGMVLIPIQIWFAFLYFDHMSIGGEFIWHFLILMFVAIFNIIYVGREMTKRR